MGCWRKQGESKSCCKVRAAPSQLYCTIHSSCNLRLQSYDLIIGLYSRYQRALFRNSYEDQSEHGDTVDNTSSPGWDADLDLDEHDVKVDEVEAESGG